MAYKITLFDYTLDGCEYCIGGGDLSQQSIQWQLEAANGQDIEVHISSVGGSLFDAIAIYDMLKKYPGKVTTYIDALAASAASVVAMAGSTIYMSKYALLMVHKPSTSVGGNSDDLESAAAMLKVCQDRLVAIYVDKTGLDQETVNSLVNATTWMTADQAKDLGFVDVVEDYAAEITNHAAIKVYASSAPAVYQRVFNKLQIKQTNSDEMKTEDKELIEKNNGLLAKVLNFFKKSTIETVTNKGKIKSLAPLNKGVAVTNEADEDLEDGEYEVDNSGTKVIAVIKGGVVDEMKTDEEDKEAVENTLVLNNAGIKVTNSADAAGIASVVKNYQQKEVEQNALIADLTNQLKVSNAAVDRDEAKIKEDIKSDFLPNGSKRSDTSKAGEVTNKMPEFLKKTIEANPQLANAINKSTRG